MYPGEQLTTVTVAGITDGLCGPLRPGHFQGVATVVAKLMLMAMPDRAFFGEALCACQADAFGCTSDQYGFAA